MFGFYGPVNLYWQGHFNFVQVKVDSKQQEQ